jgi:hypothetical protein
MEAISEASILRYNLSIEDNLIGKHRITFHAKVKPKIIETISNLIFKKVITNMPYIQSFKGIIEAWLVVTIWRLNPLIKKINFFKKNNPYLNCKLQ